MALRASLRSANAPSANPAHASGAAPRPKAEAARAAVGHMRDGLLAAMAADTVASLADMPEARAELEGLLDRRKRTQLGVQVSAERATLLPEDAYLDVPGRDPAAE